MHVCSGGRTTCHFSFDGAVCTCAIVSLQDLCCAKSKTSEVLIFPDYSKKINAFLKIIFKPVYSPLVWSKPSLSALIFPGITQYKMPRHSLPQDWGLKDCSDTLSRYTGVVHWSEQENVVPHRPLPFYLRQVRTANTNCLVVQIFTTCQESDTSSSEECSAIKDDDS